MKTLNSFGELALTLVEREVAMHEALAVGLDHVLAKLQKTAESEFGEYQAAVGPFPAWAPLSPTTLDGFGPFPGKIEKGQAPPDNPLIAEGDLKGSFSHEREGLEGLMGTTDPVMVFHEFGTSRMPARPVVGPAGFRNRDTIRKLVGAAAVMGLVGGDLIHSSLGYDFKSTDV